jgi:uncharacterized protein involved in exopolysaccharide biosynthesis
MSVDLEPRTRRPLPPDLDLEQEVDFGKYVRVVAARWWLLAVGIVAGIVVGYLASLGSGQVYQASVTIYPGQPFTPTGGAAVQGLQTNPRTVTDIVHSEAAIRVAAAQSGLRPGQLRGHVSTKTLSAGRGAAKAGQVQFVQITVQGEPARKIADAANALGRRVVNRTSGYVDPIIAGFQTRLKALNAAVTSQDKLIRAQSAAVRGASDLTPLEQLILISQLNSSQQQRAQLVDAQTETQQQLALAEQVEKPQIIEPAVARKTTARSPRNSMLVGAVIGLLLGGLAALLWDPVARRIERP